MANASVEIRRPDATSGVFTTDRDGLAAIPETSFVPATKTRETAVVFVRSGDDNAFREVSDMLDGWRLGASFDLRGDRSLTLRHTQHADRPLDDSAHEVLRHVARLWGFGVQLESVNSRGEITRRWNVPPQAH